MKKRFSDTQTPHLTVMIQCETPQDALRVIQKANDQGAKAYGFQAENLLPKYQNPEVYREIFDAMQDRPCYVTYYRTRNNQGKTDEELAEGLLKLAQSGAALCDVLGDLFAPCPGELTENQEAIQKQMQLIENLHRLGAEVLMSSHIMKFTEGEKVLEVAREHIRRGADISKIVTWAENMEQQIENLRITDLLKRELGAPFLFLTGGECQIHRRLGISMGCCMALCVYEHDALSTPVQPLLSSMQILREQFEM